MGDEQLLDEILVLDRGGGLAASAAALRLVLGEGLTLGVTGVRQRHHHVLRLDQVLGGEIQMVAVDLGPARVAIGCADLEQLRAHHLREPLGAGENVAQVADTLEQLAVLGDDLVLLQPREPMQAHVQNGLRLRLRQPINPAPKAHFRGQLLGSGGNGPGALQQLRDHARRPGARLQCGPCLGGRGGGLDERDHLIDVGECHGQAFENVGPFARLGEIVDGASRDDFAAVPDESLQHLLERHQLRLPVLQRHHVDAEHRLHRRLRIQVVEHDLGDLAALELDDHAHAVLVGLVAQAVGGDPVDQLLAHQLRDALDEPRLVDLVGELGDHDRLAIAPADLLDADARAHRQSAASGAVGGGDLLRAVDDAAGGEVRPRHVLHQRIIQQRDARVDGLGEIVRRDVGRHADRDAGLPVHQQVRHARRQHRGLLLGLVVVGREIDRLLVDVRQQLVRDARHAHLGVAHGGGHVAVHGAEIALAVDQQVAHGKRLRHAHDGVVDRGVAVRMVLADHVPDHARGLLVGLVPVVAELTHGVQHAAVHGLQSVTHVGQCPPDDHAHRIVEIGLPHLVFETDREDFAGDIGHERA